MESSQVCRGLPVWMHVLIREEHGWSLDDDYMTWDHPPAPRTRLSESDVFSSQILAPEPRRSGDLDIRPGTSPVL